MKFTFAASLIAICAFAQEDSAASVEDWTTEVPVPVEEEAEECPFLKVFEKNEEGQWQPKSLDLPQISFADVDEQAIMDWISSKEDSMAAQDQKWTDAWTSYMDAVAQPWNDFLTRAQDLSDQGHEMGIQTDEEVIRFIADNTFVDGESLNQVFPQVEEFLTQYRAEAANTHEQFNFDAFTTTPSILKRTGWLDEEGNYHPNQAMQDAYAEALAAEALAAVQAALEEAMDSLSAPLSLQSTGYFDENGDYQDDYAYPEPEQSTAGKIIEKIESTVVSYGYDQDVVQAWLSDKSASWQDIQQSQDAESAATAKADIAEAADYVKGILDNWVTDLYAKQVDDQVAFEDAVDGKVADLKSKVDEQAQTNIDNISNWFDDVYSNIKDATDTQTAEDALAGEISFAKKTTKKTKKSTASSDASFFGFGALTLGAAATCAYIYKKRSDEKSAMSQTYADSDEGFSQV